MEGKNSRAFAKHSTDTENAILVTDEYKGYVGMYRILPHKVIKHAFQYVNGDIHTNTIEEF